MFSVSSVGPERRDDDKGLHISLIKLLLAVVLVILTTGSAVISRMSAILLSQSTRDEPEPGEESVYVFVTLFLIVTAPKLMLMIHSTMLYCVRERGYYGRRVRERIRRMIVRSQKNLRDRISRQELAWPALEDVGEDSQDGESTTAQLAGGVGGSSQTMKRRHKRDPNRSEEISAPSVSTIPETANGEADESTPLLDPPEDEEKVHRSLYGPIVLRLSLLAIFEAMCECAGHILLVYYVFTRVSIPMALIAVDCYSLLPLLVVLIEKVYGGRRECQAKSIALCGFALQLTTMTLLVYRHHTILHGGAIPIAVILSSFPLFSNFLMELFFGNRGNAARNAWFDAMEDRRYFFAVLKSVLSVCIFYPIGIYVVANHDYQYSLSRLVHAFANVLTNTNSGEFDVAPYFWLFIFDLCAVIVLFYAVWFSIAIRLSLTAFIIPMTLTTSICIALRSTLCSISTSHEWLTAHVFDPLGIADSYACDEKRVFYGDIGDLVAWVCGTIGIASLLWTSFRVPSTDTARYSVFRQRLSHLRPEREIFHSFSLSSIGTDQVLLLNQRTAQSHYQYYTNSVYEYNQLMAMQPGPALGISSGANTVSGVGDIESISLRSANNMYNNTERYEHTTPHTFICVTMWRENAEEMKDVMSSVKRLLQAKIQSTFEVHIVLDSAFTDSIPCYDRSGKKVREREKRCPTGNSFVMQLLELLRGLEFEQTEPDMKAFAHGGLYTFRFQKDVSVFVHLKDQRKIKKRKRWSQILYILDCHQRAREQLKESAEHVNSKEFFLLTLDGDVGFHPSSVNWLLRLIKSDVRIAGVCGRLYPVGTGVLTAWQKVEYAFGHWFQKVSEHVLGSVLCCPGCFSMFRLTPVYSVLEDYCVEPKTPNEYVQYEQGEDRFLSTLLIRRGYVLQYSSMASAYTHCPTDFTTFFHQRRRWVTSTAANIMDMVSNQSEILRNNGSIGVFFMGYVFALLVTTLLAPSTVVLVLTAGLNYGLGFKNPGAILLMTSIYLGYTLLCMYYASRKHWNSQLAINVGSLLGVPLSLLMASVAVGVCIQLVQAIESPESIFILVLAGMFMFAALIHLNEWKVILLAPLYLILLPSMYLLLPIFAFVNVCTTQWGTREANAGQISDSSEPGEKDKDANDDSSSTGLSLLKELRYGFACSLSAPFQCICGIRKKDSSDAGRSPNPEEVPRKTAETSSEAPAENAAEESDNPSERPPDLAVRVNVEDLSRDLFEDEADEQEPVPAEDGVVSRDLTLLFEQYNLIPETMEGRPEKTDDEADNASQRLAAEIRRRKFLHKKEDFTQQLFSHRTSFVIGWTTLNLIWIIVVMEFADHQTLHIKKWDNENAISFVFLSGFGVVLLIQLYAMVIHRLGTLVTYFSSLEVIGWRDRHSSRSMNRSLTEERLDVSGL